MKRFLTGLLVLTGYLSYAQAYPVFEASNELKFNMGLFLANTTVDLGYEYYLNEDTSIGATVYFDDEPTDYNGNFGIGPNFRAYFGYGPRSGFFAEAFGLYHTGENEVSSAEPGRRNNDYSTLALGLGIGNKWVTRSQRFSLEVNAGLGRNINPEDFQDSFVYRLGLFVGFRF